LSTTGLVQKILEMKDTVEAINVEKPNLETVFLNLTGKKLRD
jgi:hypothetical protein